MHAVVIRRFRGMKKRCRVRPAAKNWLIGGGTTTANRCRRAGNGRSMPSFARLVRGFHFVVTTGHADNAKITGCGLVTCIHRFDPDRIPVHFFVISGGSDDNGDDQKASRRSGQARRAGVLQAPRQIRNDSVCPWWLPQNPVGRCSIFDDVPSDVATGLSG